MKPRDNSHENINLLEGLKDKSNITKNHKILHNKRKIKISGNCRKEFWHFVEENFGID